MSTLLAELLESGVAPAVLLLVKATLLLVLGATAALLLPQRAAAARHLVWTLTLALLLVLPLAVRGVPHWQVPVSVPPPVLTGEAAQLSEATSSTETAPAAAGSPASLGDADVARSEAWWLRVPTPAGLVFVWLLGAAAVLAWLLAGRVALYVMLRRAERLDGASWEEPARDAAWLLELGRRVPLYRSAAVSVPVTWGALRPVVVLPPESVAWPMERRRVVLLHELAHVKRRDCLAQLVAALVCAAYWFHPGVWYGARRMRVEREHACDDLVLAAGTAPADYAAHLLELARRFRASFPAPLVALHMARPSHLEGRLLTVLAGPSAHRPPSGRAAAAAALAALLLLLPVAALHPALAAQQAPQSAHADAERSVDAESAADAGTDVGEQPLPPPVAEALPVSAATVVQPDAPAPLVADTPPARGGRSGDLTIASGSSIDTVARLVPRMPLSAAAFAITSADGRTALLLRDSTLVLQLTDRGLEEVAKVEAGDEERSFLSALLNSMLRGGLRLLLDRGIEYSLTDLREARYEDGRLRLVSVRGSDIFENVEVFGDDLMTTFDPRDARAFAARANAARGRLRR